MARKPTRSRSSKRPPSPALRLRLVIYLAGAAQMVAAQGTESAPIALGVVVALTSLALLASYFRDSDENGMTTALVVIEALLVSFLVYFSGVKSAILIVPVVLACLVSVERGLQPALFFALVNSLGWLAPTLMDRNLGNMNLLEVLFRVAILCAAPFVGTTRPPRRADRPDDSESQFQRQQGLALETAQKNAKSESEARARREQELYHERRKLEALMEIAHRMAVLRNPDELLATIVDCARDQLQVEIAVILLRRGNQLVVEWKEGIIESSAVKLNGTIGQGLLGRLASAGSAFSYTQSDGVEPLRPFWPLEGMEQLIPALRQASQSGYQPRPDDLRNFIVVPLQTPIDQMPLGLILLGNRRIGERFDTHDQGYLQILATDAAISIRNLFFLAERERTHDEMIRALAQAIEAKDPYTSGHVARVCTYSMKLAQAMGMPESFLKELNTAAMLHDVGKISTPDNVLMKQGPLTDEEFEVMKQHVVHSARIIRDIRSVSPEIQKMVLYHHERCDGKGYPEGLKGEQIPLGAQIISIADAYDAMTSHRPYRKGMEPAEALSRLEKGAGTQFDGRVLSYFMALANYEPQQNAELRQWVWEAKQRVAANLLRTPAANVSAPPRTAAPASGPARRGPERLQVDSGPSER